MTDRGRKRPERQRTLPNREAFRMAFRSLKIRIWRSMITMAGIVLAIAFLAYVVTSNTLERGVDLREGAAMEGSGRDQATVVWLISISLVVCVVGITNAMLMSVTERYREIGTMKCLGALDWFVVKLFLIEAGLQGMAGSAIGALAGFAAAMLAGMTQHDGVLSTMPWWRVLVGLLFALAVGTALSIAGAIYPAHRAGKMPPADAMRTEV